MTNQKQDLSCIQSEILTYLAGHPSRLKERGNLFAGDLALDLGNCLVWICGKLDSAPLTAQPIEETAQSVYALGKQFQEVGRRLLDLNKGSRELNDRLEHFVRDLDALRTRAAILESQRGTV